MVRASVSRATYSISCSLGAQLLHFALLHFALLLNHATHMHHCHSRTADGYVYEGSFEGGKRHGMGTLTTPDGSTEVGEWSKGTMVRADLLQSAPHVTGHSAPTWLLMLKSLAPVLALITSRSPHAHLTLSHLTLSHLALSHLARPPCTPTLPSHPNRSQKTRSSRRLRSPRWWTASAKQRRTRRRSRASSLGTRCWGRRRWEYTLPRAVPRLAMHRALRALSEPRAVPCLAMH